MNFFFYFSTNKSNKDFYQDIPSGLHFLNSRSPWCDSIKTLGTSYLLISSRISFSTAAAVATHFYSNLIRRVCFKSVFLWLFSSAASAASVPLCFIVDVSCGYANRHRSNKKKHYRKLLYSTRSSSLLSRYLHSVMF